MVIFSILYGTCFSSSHSQHFWQYGHLQNGWGQGLAASLTGRRALAGGVYMASEAMHVPQHTCTVSASAHRVRMLYIHDMMYDVGAPGVVVSVERDTDV